jgi:AcrR family transcriptional regulator
MPVASRAVDTRARRYDPAETRQRVLEAANLLFSTKGYACTGTADIARAADVSEGSIFYHFGSKKNLLIDIGRMYGERMIAVMQGDDALADLEPGIMISRCVNFAIEHRDWETLTGQICAEGKPKTMMAAEAEPFYHASREVTIAWCRADDRGDGEARHRRCQHPRCSGIDLCCRRRDDRGGVEHRRCRPSRRGARRNNPLRPRGVRIRGLNAAPRRTILDLGPAFYDQVAAANFPQTIVRFRNNRAAGEVGLDGLSDADWVAHFGRFAPLPDSLETPLALRYHGHQFRVYNPDLGDGRGFLFAQLDAACGRLMDLGTKGSGTTPWSRAGDGRLTLKGAVREVLATEMLEALGVDTSRTLSVIETGEALERGDEPSPTRSAVLVRLSHSR